jgi:hypothetical protein
MAGDIANLGPTPYGWQVPACSRLLNPHRSNTHGEAEGTGYCQTGWPTGGDGLVVHPCYQPGIGRRIETTHVPSVDGGQ